MKKKIEKLVIEGITYIPEFKNDGIGELDLGSGDFLTTDGTSAMLEYRNDNDNGDVEDDENSTEILAKDLVRVAMFLLKLHEKNKEDE